MVSALKNIEVRSVETPIDQEKLARPIKVLLIKPYQLTATITEAPPLGLMCLSASLKQQFKQSVETHVFDMKLLKISPERVVEELEKFKPDIVGVSALNCEAAVSRELAAIIKKHDPSLLTVLGGPYAHKRADEILVESEFDWVINGPGDRTFINAIRRYINGHELGTDIPGLSYRQSDKQLHITNTQDTIDDLDALPIPDWSQVNFDEYSRRMTMLTMQKGRRYASIFTSRGCPYLCNYCHDIFGKRFKFQSAERVIREIEYLHETHGVTEFQIIDDIFNLHKPRVKQIMHEVHRRWPGKLHFCFPNGVRADIIDEEVLDDLRLGGTYAMCVAVESATPRLQDMVEKYLDVDKTQWVIEQADKRGILVIGFFMLGFPTETPAELQATMDFALKSKLTLAHMFTVIPQPGTPLYPIAETENKKALLLSTKDDEEGKLSYRGERGAASWYERTYGFPLNAYIHRNVLKFYFSPSRLWRILRRVPMRSIIQNSYYFARMELERRINQYRGRKVSQQTIAVDPMP